MARKHCLTPLAAVAGGLLAGAVGTVCLDTVQYLRYRRRGGTESPLAWEFAPVQTWEQAPDPGQVARRVIEGFTQRKLPDRWAFPISTAMHWAYGSGAAAAYGILAGSLRRPDPWYGLPFGAGVWASGYVILPEGGLYRPIWEYDAKTLAWDLSGHLAYGAGTGTTFWLLAKGNVSTWWVYLIGPVAGAVIAVGVAQVLRGPAKVEEAKAAQGTPLDRTP